MAESSRAGPRCRKARWRDGLHDARHPPRERTRAAARGRGASRLVPRQARHPPAPGGLGVRGRRRELLDPGRRDAGPRRRVGVRQDDDRPGRRARQSSARRARSASMARTCSRSRVPSCVAAAAESRWCSRIRTPRSIRARPSGEIIGEPLAIHGLPADGDRRRRDRGAAQAGEPRCHVRGPLPPRVQRRPAAADRHRAGARGRARAHRVRRADLRPRRLGPGAGHQPSRAAPGASWALPTCSSPTTSPSCGISPTAWR